MVPNAMISPRRKSTLPRARWRFAATTDLPHDVGQISADREIPVNPSEAQRRSSDKTPADAEESTEDANQKPDYDEVNWINVGVRDGEEHYSERPPRKNRSRLVVTHSRKTACPIIRRIATTAYTRMAGFRVVPASLRENVKQQRNSP